MTARENRTGLYEMPLDPELPDMFRIALRSLELRSRSHSIARIVTYDATTQTANVLVDILQVVKDHITPPTEADPNPTKTLPPTPLNNIKVAFPRTSTGYLTFPVNPGDFGELHIQDRSIDLWRQTGLPSDPVSAFVHMLGDSVWHPNIFPDTLPLPPTSLTATVLEGPTIRLGRSATVALARDADPIVPSEAMFAWALVLETAVNALAPGSFTPANSFLGTVSADFGTVFASTIKSFSE